MQSVIPSKQQSIDHGPDRIIAIHRPEPGELRMRRVITRSGTRVRIKVASWKMGRAVHAESRDEAVALRLLDGDPSVKAFHEQPSLIEYVHNGSLRRHFPDVEVDYGDRKVFWEVKGQRQASELEIQSRTAFMRDHLANLGFGYELVISEQLKLDARLGTIEFLRRWGRAEVSLVHYEQVRLHAQLHGGLRWGDFNNPDGAMSRGTACRLALEGRLRFEISRPITPDVVLELVEEAG